MLMWLHTQIQMYFDGTFCCAPDPFKQCLIVMIYAAREHKYIPLMWILLTGKTSHCYNEAISWVSRCLPGGLCPDVAFGGTDFEPAFFGAVKIFFRDTFLVGCRFHLKQAVRRRLLKMGMHRCVVAAILSMLDYAPMLPDNEIVQKEVPYLKWLVEEYLKSQRKGKLLLEYKKQWDVFWKYFEE